MHILLSKASLAQQDKQEDRARGQEALEVAAMEAASTAHGKAAKKLRLAASKLARSALLTT